MPRMREFTFNNGKEDKIIEIKYILDKKEYKYHLYDKIQVTMYFFHYEKNIQSKIKLKII